MFGQLLSRGARLILTFRPSRRPARASAVAWRRMMDPQRACAGIHTSLTGGNATMSKASSRTYRVAGLLALALAVPVVAGAADVAAGTDTLEDVVVTARKREENVRDVPVSVVTFSASDLAARNADDLSSLGNSIPNVTIGTSSEDRLQNIVIRGISTVTRSIGEETGVAVYLDGVYTGRIETYNQELADVDQVEVLRGPQGTIFGKNTTEGAINITTIRPSDTPTGSATISYGNFGLVEGSGFLSGPIKEGLLYGKISLYGATDNGYATNVFNDTKAGDRHDLGGRFQLRTTPNEDLDITFSGDYTRHHNDPYRFEVTTGTFGNIPGPFTFDEAYPSTQRTENGGAALNIQDRLPGGYTLTSITSWRESYWTDHDDETWNGQNLAYSDYTEHTNYASQELRIASPAKSKLEYVAGLYYAYQYSTTHTPVSIGDGLATIFGIPDGLESFDLRSDVKTNSYAAFANGSYHLDPTWTLTVGGRYTFEQKHLYYQQLDPDSLGFVPNIGPLTRGYSQGDFTPTVSVVYALTDRVNFYATVASGYKSGGFNVDTLSTADHIQFGPGKVTNYELGAKGSFLGGRLQADIDVFHMDYNDLQVTQYDPASFSNFIGNAASAKINGLEFDAVGRVTPNWTVSGNIGLLDTKFDTFIDQYGNSLAGERLTFAPKFSGSVATRYSVPVAANVDAYVNGEFDYRSSVYSQYNDIATTPANILGAYGLLNGSIGLSFDHARWKVEAYGRNLTNRLYELNQTTQLPLLSFLPPYDYEETTTTYGMPRTYGISLKARF
jgi:iron complex outermembrane receptor protein